MIMFDNVTITCDKCRGDCYAGVSETYDGMAEVFAYCPTCNGVEMRPTDLMDVEKQIGHDYDSLSDLWDDEEEDNFLLEDF